MDGVEERLNYLTDTKEQLRQTINENGGDLSEEAPFSDYPEQVQYIVDNAIIPQSTLNDLTEDVLDINNFNYLDNMTLYNSNGYLSFKFPGKLEPGFVFYSDSNITVSLIEFLMNTSDGWSSSQIRYTDSFPIRFSYYGSHSNDFTIQLGAALMLTRITTCGVNMISSRGYYNLPKSRYYIQKSNYSGGITDKYAIGTIKEESSPLGLFVIPKIELVKISDHTYEFTEEEFNKIKEYFATYINEFTGESYL